MSFNSALAYKHVLCMHVTSTEVHAAAVERASKKIADKLGNKQFDDYNTFVPLLNKTIKELKLDKSKRPLEPLLHGEWV